MENSEKVDNKIACGTDTCANYEDTYVLPVNKNKITCWNCMKMVLKESSIVKDFNLSLINQKVVKI